MSLSRWDRNYASQGMTRPMNIASLPKAVFTDRARGRLRTIALATLGGVSLFSRND